MLELVPVSLKEANAFVARYHRHHKPVVGHKFSVAAAVNGELDTETGASLRATGWRCIGEAGGKRWTGVRRPEVDLYPAQMKMRFEVMK